MPVHTARSPAALGRDPGKISRELRRNAATHSGQQEYRATVAQWKAQQAAKRPKSAKLLGNDRLREYVQESQVVQKAAFQAGQVRGRLGNQWGRG